MESKPTFEKETISIACIGECMVELSPLSTPQHTDNTQPGYQQGFAGDTLNTAVYMARLLHHLPASVQYVTALGKDSLSQTMLKHWQNEHINCQYVVQLEDKTPGLYMIQTDDAGERSFSYWRSDSAAKQLFSNKGLNEETQQRLTETSDYLYISGISLAILDEPSQQKLFSLLQIAKHNGTRVVFDSNYRPRLWASHAQAQYVHNQALALADIALLTFDDETLLYGDTQPEETLQRCKHIGEVVVKMGAEGCLIQQDHEILHVPSETIATVTDTTAAGDSFNGAYLAARLIGLGSTPSAQFAHKVAGTVIQHKGAIIPLSHTQPFTQELTSLWTA